jgi:hypothetical protein
MGRTAQRRQERVGDGQHPEQLLREPSTIDLAGCDHFSEHMARSTFRIVWDLKIHIDSRRRPVSGSHDLPHHAGDPRAVREVGAVRRTLARRRGFGGS